MAGQKRKTRMISMRLTEEQFRLIEVLSSRIKRKTGFKITRASIIQRLMFHGLPLLEREFPKDVEDLVVRDGELDKSRSA